MLHTTTLPGRVLPYGVIHQVVVQEGEVVVKRYWPAAGVRGRVPGPQPPVVSDVVKDLVIVCLGLPTRSRAVPEYHLLLGLVAQTQVCHIEMDLFQHAALSPSSSFPIPPPGPLSSSSSSSFSPTTPLTHWLLPPPSVASPGAQVDPGGGRGGGGEG